MAFSGRKKKYMADDEVIVLENVSKKYQAGVQALNDVSIRIKKGEFVFIVGDSGSGKSTLIKLLLKELMPTEGNIYVLNYNLNRLKHRKVPKFRRNIGVVFQDFRLLRDRNVYENVAFAQRIVQVPGKLIRRNVPSILATVGLAGKYKAKPDRLSGGEQQRVAIAPALVTGSQVILADEPTGNLDSENSRHIVEILQKLAHKEGRCVIVVTHDPEVAEAADLILRMKDGVLIAE